MAHDYIYILKELRIHETRISQRFLIVRYTPVPATYTKMIATPLVRTVALFSQPYAGVFLYLITYVEVEKNCARRPLEGRRFLACYLLLKVFIKGRLASFVSRLKLRNSPNRIEGRNYMRISPRANSCRSSDVQ